MEFAKNGGQKRTEGPGTVGSYRLWLGLRCHRKASEKPLGVSVRGLMWPDLRFKNDYYGCMW